MTKIELVKGDITKVEIEAIVNAANKTLLGGGGVDGAIHKVAGPQLLKECIALKGCKTGEAKITKGYNLPCKYVIHTVGPIWKGGVKEEALRLSECYYSSLWLAMMNNIRNIAFPSISTGVYKFPVDKAAFVAVNAVKMFTAEHPDIFDSIMWVLFDDETMEAYERALTELSE